MLTFGLSGNVVTGRIVAGREIDARIQPIYTQEMVVRRAALRLPVKGEYQIGGAVRNEDVAVGVNLAGRDSVGVRNTAVVGDVQPVAAADSGVHIAGGVRGRANVPLVGLRAVDEHPLLVLDSIFEICRVR